jgi:hypothetical protein
MIHDDFKIKIIDDVGDTTNYSTVYDNLTESSHMAKKLFHEHNLNCVQVHSMGKLVFEISKENSRGCFTDNDW